MTLVWLARIGLLFYVLYSIAFKLEGFEPRGSVGLKALAVAAELLIYTVFVWVGFFL